MVESFLISLCALCVITTVLAILMVIADATIGNYGRATLTINDSRKIEVNAGQSLLTTLKEEGLFIPSACGGRGSCGLCKLRVPAGGAPLPTELPWLSDAERQQGMRLACQIKVKGDLACYVPEALFNVKSYQAQVVAMRDLTYDIKEIVLTLIDPPAMVFEAGQFVQLEIPPYALTSETIYRAYSVASDPINTGRIELEIRYVPNGISTTYVHKHMKVGDRILFNGPHGEFLLHEGEGEILCVAGGSGMAPIRSILTAMCRMGEPRRVRYFFGARARRDLFLVDEMRALEQRMPNFQFIPSLSNPMPEDHWTGEVGRITDVVDRHLENGAGRHAYLCGNPLMIDACLKVLKSKGVPESQIFYDKFA